MQSQQTKYILCGGIAKATLTQAQAFAQEVTKGLEKPSIVFCGFAKPEAEWEMRKKEIESLFTQFTDISTPLIIASRSSFIKEIEKHPIIYLAGGNTPDLYAALTHYSTDPLFWKKLFAGKVIVGTSAGVNVLTTLSYNVDHQIFQKGLGILPIASLVHYLSSTYKAGLGWSEIEKLLRGKTDLPLYCIKDGEFAVLHSDEK